MNRHYRHEMVKIFNSKSRDLIKNQASFIESYLNKKLVFQNGWGALQSNI